MIRIEATDRAALRAIAHAWGARIGPTYSARDIRKAISAAYRREVERDEWRAAHARYMAMVAEGGR
jgi:hypothetical protein